MWTHQQEAVSWARDRHSALLHLGMGCGKTRIAFEILRARGHGLVLVCCPKAVIPAWEKQGGLWAPEYRVLLLDRGTSTQKASRVSAALASTEPLVVVVNYETAYRMKVLEATKWHCVVYDEIHRLKSPSGVTSRWAAKLGKLNPSMQRIGLSGTMVSQSPLDAWAVWRAVEAPNISTFSDTYTLFKARYAVTNPHIPGMVVAWRNLDDLNRRIAATTFHRKSEDVLDLPPIMHHRVPCELTAPEADLYWQVQRDFCAVVEQGEIVPSNVLVQLLRLLEICGGHVHYQNENGARQIGDRPTKLAAISDLLADLPEPAVVFAKRRAEVAAVIAECKKLGRSASELSGTKNELAQWQSGKTDILVANTASGGVGVDLTRACYGFFYSLGHGLSEYCQAIARLHRPGQTKTTHLYSLVAETGGSQTVDGEVYEALDRRQEVIDAIIDARRGARVGS